MPSTFDNRFRAFLGSLPGATSVDEMPEFRHVDGVRRADFLLRGRTVVAEVKSLEDTREGTVQKLVEGYKCQRWWRPPPRTMDWPEVARMQPDGDALRDEVFLKVTGPVKAAFRDAQAQITSTKHHLGLPAARGLLILLNSKAYIMDLKAAAFRISRLLWLGPGVPRPEYDAIAVIMVVSAVDVVLLDDGSRNDPCLVITRKDDGGGEARSAADEIIAGWAMLNGQGLVMDRTMRDESSLREIHVVSRYPKYDV